MNMEQISGAVAISAVSCSGRRMFGKGSLRLTFGMLIHKL
jgi:hypothetical protein